jgi:hypothetical protein
MLKTILSTLNGHASELDSLNAALVQLRRDRAAATAQLTALNAERRQALLDDASDAALDKLERQIDRKTIHLEKLSISEEPLKLKIAAAKKVALDAAVARHFDIIEKAHRKYCSSLRQADTDQGVLAYYRDAAQAECGERAVVHIPLMVFGGLLGHGHAQTWDEETTQDMKAARRTQDAIAATEVPLTPNVPKVLLAKPVPKKPAPSMQHIVTDITGQRSKDRFTAVRTVDDLSPLQDGFVRVKVLRAGWCPADDVPQCHFGQIVKVGRAKAVHAAATGALEILQES